MLKLGVCWLSLRCEEAVRLHQVCCEYPPPAAETPKQKPSDKLGKKRKANRWLLFLKPPSEQHSAAADESSRAMSRPGPDEHLGNCASFCVLQLRVCWGQRFGRTVRTKLALISPPLIRDWTRSAELLGILEKQLVKPTADADLMRLELEGTCCTRFSSTPHTIDFFRFYSFFFFL